MQTRLGSVAGRREELSENSLSDTVERDDIGLQLVQASRKTHIVGEKDIGTVLNQRLDTARVPRCRGLKQRGESRQVSNLHKGRGEVKQNGRST